MVRVASARRTSLTGLVFVFCSCLAGLYVAGRLWTTTRQLYYLVSEASRAVVARPAHAHVGSYVINPAQMRFQESAVSLMWWLSTRCFHTATGHDRSKSSPSSRTTGCSSTASSPTARVPNFQLQLGASTLGPELTSTCRCVHMSSACVSAVAPRLPVDDAGETTTFMLSTAHENRRHRCMPPQSRAAGRSRCHRCSP